jgi:hypothetical protein
LNIIEVEEPLKKQRLDKDKKELFSPWMIAGAK